jgi:hypothetical protein
VSEHNEEEREHKRGELYNEAIGMSKHDLAETFVDSFTNQELDELLDEDEEETRDEQTRKSG